MTETIPTTKRLSGMRLGRCIHPNKETCHVSFKSSFNPNWRCCRTDRRSRRYSNTEYGGTIVSDDALDRIAEHRHYQSLVGDICRRMGDLDELPEERRRAYHIRDRGTDVGKDDDPRWTAIQAEYWSAVDRVDEIAWSFVDRPPTTVAGVATAALEPPASSTESRLFELERQVAAAEAAAVEAGRPHSEAEGAMFAWERQNPRPTPRGVSTLKETMQLVQSSIDEEEGQIPASVAAEKRSQARSLITEKMADADREHAEALKSWEARRSIARTNCHYEEREALNQRLLDEADAIRDEAATIPATTIAGLRCKARMLTEADLSCMNGSLFADSIIDELRAAA